MKNETIQLALFSKVGANGRHEDADHGGEERAGYRFVKRIGWIPRNWNVQNLGSIISNLEAGYSAASTDRPANEGEKGVLKVSAVSEGVLRLQENKSVVPDDLDKLKCPLRAGSIVISRSNGNIALVGACAYVESDHTDLYLPDTLWQIEAEEGTSAQWLNQLLRAQYVRARIEQVASGGSGNKKISMQRLKGIKVAVPPLPEQRKIARILGAWDRALADLDALIEAKRQRKEGLAQRLLTGRLRLPGFEGKPWRRVRLTEVTRESRKRNDGSLGEDRLYGVTKAEGMIPNQDRIQVDDVSRYKIVRPKAFAYNPMRLNIGSIARLEEPFPVLVSPDYVVFECRPDQLDPDYLNHVRRSHQWHRFMERAGSGSVRVRIYFNHLRLMKLKLPSDIEEQRRIAAVLNAAAAEVAALEARRDALARQKKGLMQRLLTGEIRVTPDRQDGYYHAERDNAFTSQE